ncbi:hypothetical protein JXA70_19225 [candidate division KSB1 bacterium]|nr:hypothetical protein [candidate division KSB1 bacterium]
MSLVDVSDSANPFACGAFQMGAYVRGLAVDDVYIYVAGGQDGLYIIRNNLLTTIDGGAAFAPDSHLLAQNYPNPFNQSTRICYTLAYAGHVTLKIYGIEGNLISTLVSEYQTAGTHSAKYFLFAS